MKMEASMFVETENLQHSMRYIITAYLGGLFNVAFIVDITELNGTIFDE
jgi:hypothetical protein